MSDEAYKWFWIGAVIGPFLWWGLFSFIDKLVDWGMKKL